ncbi:MAG: bifunctional DNA-formamidopyrimidine glycosylase/DNA-(apurinic or apyrimidinic site) lyase [Candidatus Cloacimonetes bacterium]|nr:bifunctional DNA-formamidopyrimidine glycosylase/DNA-(apurinic or apyrimidinic site) lyase [Candidatus Cloacimonadota bacterium]
MPELPEVQTVLDGFISSVANKAIVALECYYPGTVIVDEDLPSEPFPAVVISSYRRGKYMVINLSGGSSLIIHLRMTGKLVAACDSTDILPHERARICLQGGEVIHFIDIRTFGKIIHCVSQNVPSYLPKLGFEPLEQDFTPVKLHKLLAGKKAPIKSVLLDQNIIAGLGNIYVCEILYRAGIAPTAIAGSLSSKAAISIVQHTKEVLNEAIRVGGTSISDFRRIDDKTGEFQHFLRVYQKKTCPLGHEVTRIVQSGRSSFFCPVCQATD